MTNLTLKVFPEKAEELKSELLRRGFYELESPGLKWLLTDGENTLRLYPSGTLLIQGKRTEAMKELVLSLIEAPSSTDIGCDESGKGDVFGPLVLCCAVIKPEYYKKVLSLNMRDCKRMKDEEVLRKADLFRSFGEFRCRLVEPGQLNELYQKSGNLNRILDALYGELLEGLFKKYPSASFFVDAYSKKSPFDKRVQFEHRGEERLAVATASVLARAEFLTWLRRHNLPKGSSPQVMELARRIYRQDAQMAKKLLKTFFL